MYQAWRSKIVKYSDSFLCPFAVIGRKTYIQCLTRSHNLIQGLHCFFQWRIRIKAVGIEDIHVLQSHSFEALITASYKIFFRSEEHTSELQSRENLVCRLLLEKQNTE